MLGNFKKDDSIEETKDRVGGASNGPTESGMCLAVIETAYVGESTGGATCINITAKGENGENIRLTEYISSGKKKGQKNYYERDGKKHYLPGFKKMDDLSLLLTGEHIAEMEPEEKVISLWDYDEKKEMPTAVQMMMDWCGQEVYLGLQRVISDINVKDAKGDYQPTGFTRLSNELSTSCHPETKLTVNEMIAEVEESVFFDKWVEKNTGNDYDKSAAKNGHIPKGSTAPTANAAETKPKKSIFGKKG